MRFPCSFAGVLHWAFNPQGPCSLKAVILLSLHDCIVAPPVLSIERGFFLITQRKASHPLWGHAYLTKNKSVTQTSFLKTTSWRRRTIEAAFLFSKNLPNLVISIMADFTRGSSKHGDVEMANRNGHYNAVGSKFSLVIFHFFLLLGNIFDFQKWLFAERKRRVSSRPRRKRRK